MTLFAGLLAALSANSPPVLVPDARFSVAVWCLPTCEETAVENLRTRLGKDFTIRRVLPRRQASGPVISIRELDAASYGLYPPELLDTVAPSLDDATRAKLPDAQQVLLIAGAAPGGPKFHNRLARLNRAVGEMARSQGAVVEDVDTREIYSVDAWIALRADALAGDTPLLWEQIALQWSEDGDRVVTLGLRKLGLHELSMRGLDPSLADDVLATLVLAASTEWQHDFYDNQVELSVDALTNEAARYWLGEWMVSNPGVEGRAGSGRAWVTVRNAVPWPGDPPGPILELSFGDSADPQSVASAMDELWGYGASPVAVPNPPPPEEPMAIPVDSGWK